MSVRLDGAVIRLEGECHVEDAEALAVLLDGHPDRSVDAAACRHLHGAVAQALLYYRPTVTGAPDDGFLREWVLPNLDPGATERSKA